MCLSVIFLLVLSCTYLARGQLASVPTDAPLSCEGLDVPLCSKLGYNSTYLPNLRGHVRQAEANLEFEQYIPLIQSECSPYITHFLCSFYFPFCVPTSGQGRVLNSCRSLCELVQPNCERALAGVGISWPPFLVCSLDYFVIDSVCVGSNNFTPQNNNVGIGNTTATEGHVAVTDREMTRNSVSEKSTTVGTSPIVTVLSSSTNEGTIITTAPREVTSTASREDITSTSGAIRNSYSIINVLFFILMATSYY